MKLRSLAERFARFRSVSVPARRGECEVIYDRRRLPAGPRISGEWRPGSLLQRGSKRVGGNSGFPRGSEKDGKRGGRGGGGGVAWRWGGRRGGGGLARRAGCAGIIPAGFLGLQDRVRCSSN